VFHQNQAENLHSDKMEGQASSFQALAEKEEHRLQGLDILAIMVIWIVAPFQN
jgi:hypothetical protein